MVNNYHRYAKLKAPGLKKNKPVSLEFAVFRWKYYTWLNLINFS
jgi:hypothetical protein